MGRWCSTPNVEFRSCIVCIIRKHNIEKENELQLSVSLQTCFYEIRNSQVNFILAKEKKKRGGREPCWQDGSWPIIRKPPGDLGLAQHVMGLKVIHSGIHSLPFFLMQFNSPCLPRAGRWRREQISLRTQKLKRITRAIPSKNRLQSHSSPRALEE